MKKSKLDQTFEAYAYAFESEFGYPPVEASKELRSAYWEKRANPSSSSRPLRSHAVEIGRWVSSAG